MQDTSISRMLETLDAEETGQQATHDTTGTRPRVVGTTRRQLGASDRRGAAPIGQDPSEPVQEAPTETPPAEVDYVNHPPHYTAHPSGVECIIVTEWYNFNVGNAIKYCWRAREKGAEIEDLKKARWYIDREIGRLEKLRDGKEKVV